VSSHIDLTRLFPRDRHLSLCSLGPSINLPSFSTATILWDSGYSTGWISHYPSSPSIHAIATNASLTISYPPSVAFPSNSTSNHLTLAFSALATIGWGPSFMANNSETLPGLKLSLSGNVVESNSTRKFTYNADGINGCESDEFTFACRFTKLTRHSLAISFDVSRLL
jgi:hypothetical protein